MAFSFPANVKRLFLASNKTENLSCIDILKTHACVLIIIGQRMLYSTGQPLQNPKNLDEVYILILYSIYSYIILIINNIISTYHIHKYDVDNRLILIRHKLIPVGIR